MLGWSAETVLLIIAYLFVYANPISQMLFQLKSGSEKCGFTWSALLSFSMFQIIVPWAYFLNISIDYLVFHNSVESPIFIWFASPLHFYVNLKLISMMEIPFELSWFCFVVVFHLSYLCQVYYPLLNIFKFCFRY